MTLHVCANCGAAYTWQKSLSSLKMTYCTTLCETKHLGFHLSSLERGLYEAQQASIIPVVASSVDPIEYGDMEEFTEEDSEDDDDHFGVLVPV